MKKIKAVVLETGGSQCTVLADDGSFRKVPNPHRVQVGEEIEFQVESGWGLSGRSAWKAWSAVAALLLFTLTLSLGWNFAQASTAVAMVSLDINPSVELTLNAREQVIKAVATNVDGETTLKNLKLSKEPVAMAISKILEQASNLGFLNQENSWVLIGLAPSGERQMPAGLAETVESAKEKVKARMAVLQLSEQERIQAEQAGVSIGEYALWQSAAKAGRKVEAKELKSKAERSRMLEAPEVQAQVLKDKGMLHIPVSDGKVNPAEENKLEQDKDKTKEKGEQEGIPKAKGNDINKNYSLKVPMKTKTETFGNHNWRDSFQPFFPVFSRGLGKVRIQDNGTERTKEDANGGDKEHKSGINSDGASNQGFSGKKSEK